MATNLTTLVLADDMETAQCELIATKTADMLISCSPHFEDMGFKNLDLLNLYLAQAIPVYEVLNGTLELLQVECYPILDEGQIVALSLKYEVEGELFTQITSYLVEEINNYISFHSQIALIFDDSSVYATDGNTLTKLMDYQNGKGDREHLSLDARSVSGVQAHHLLTNIEFCKPSEFIKLNCDIVSLDPSTDTLLDVPFYTNDYIPGGNCAHSCIASVGKYLTGRDISPKTLYDNFGLIHSYSSLTSCLKKYYGCSYKGTNYGGNYFTKVSESTWAGYPCIAVLDPDNGERYSHALVLAGFYIKDSTRHLYVMDPNHPTYELANVTSTGSIYYIRPDGFDRISFAYGTYM